MDQLKSMSVFLAVAEEEGFARAARRLNMSPPSVTRAVTDLEARLGARLLHRTTRKVELTDAGHRYLADCRRILADIKEADQHAAGIHAAPSGLVTVTGSVMFGRLMVLPALMEALEQYPDISIRTLFVDRVVHLVNEGIDVAVRIAELPDSSLSAIRVGAVRRILVASPDYLANHGQPRKPTDLDQHRLIDFVNLAPSGEWIFDEDGKKRAHRLKARLQLNSAEGAIDAANAHHGITRVLSYMVSGDLKVGRLKRVLQKYEPPPVPVHVVHKEAGQTSARVRAIVDYLVAHLRKSPVLKKN